MVDPLSPDAPLQRLEEELAEIKKVGRKKKVLEREAAINKLREQLNTAASEATTAATNFANTLSVTIGPDGKITSVDGSIPFKVESGQIVNVIQADAPIKKGDALPPATTHSDPFWGYVCESCEGIGGWNNMSIVNTFRCVGDDRAEGEWDYHYHDEVNQTQVYYCTCCDCLLGEKDDLPKRGLAWECKSCGGCWMDGDDTCGCYSDDEEDD